MLIIVKRNNDIVFTCFVSVESTPVQHRLYLTSPWTFDSKAFGHFETHLVNKKKSPTMTAVNGPSKAYHQCNAEPFSRLSTTNQIKLQTRKFNDLRNFKLDSHDAKVS